MIVKKMQFALLVLFVLFGAASADLGIHLFSGIAQGTAEPFSRGIAAPLLVRCGLVTPEQLLAAFCVLLLVTGALFAGSIACAAGRALQSKMARDGEETGNAKSGF